MKKNPALEINAPTTSQSRPEIQAEVLISSILRIGVLLCASIISFGLGLRFLQELPFPVFSFQSNSLNTSTSIIHEILRGQLSSSYQVVNSLHGFQIGLLAFDSDTWIAFGLILLIFLPFSRVAMTIFVFLLERDWIYFGLTLLVFSILVGGLYFGKAGS